MPYEISERVVVDLQGMLVLGAGDLEGRTEATGTVIDKPGGVLYNIRLDHPLPPDVKTIDFVGGSRLKPLGP